MGWQKSVVQGSPSSQSESSTQQVGLVLWVHMFSDTVPQKSAVQISVIAIFIFLTAVRDDFSVQNSCSQGCEVQRILPGQSSPMGEHVPREGVTEQSLPHTLPKCGDAIITRISITGHGRTGTG